MDIQVSEIESSISFWVMYMFLKGCVCVHVCMCAYVYANTWMCRCLRWTRDPSELAITRLRVSVCVCVCACACVYVRVYVYEHMNVQVSEMD